MQITDNINHKNSNDNEINLLGIFNIIFKEIWLVIFVTSFVSLLALVVSLTLSDIYKSEAILSPVKIQDNISGSLDRLSGLANLTGFSLPSQGAESNAAKALMKLSTLSFFENNLIPSIALPELMAVKSWDKEQNILIYDSTIYNEKNSSWIREIPTAQEGFKIFEEEHFSIIEDKKSGFITISIKHKSPYVAKKWVELIFNEINIFYRQKDKIEAEKAVNFLNSQMLKTNLSEVKFVIAELLQQETQKLMLIEANDSYVFEYIDPPALMEKKTYPKRALICIFGTIIGGLLGILLAFFKSFRSNLATI